MIKRFSECESKYAKNKIDKDYEMNFKFKAAITKWGKPISYRNLTIEKFKTGPDGTKLPILAKVDTFWKKKNESQ